MDNDGILGQSLTLSLSYTSMPLAPSIPKAHMVLFSLQLWLCWTLGEARPCGSDL